VSLAKLSDQTFLALCSWDYSAASSRPCTAPGGVGGSRGICAQQEQQPGVAVRLQPEAPPPPTEPPYFIKRHVQNTAAALKAAVLDEIVGEPLAGVIE